MTRYSERPRPEPHHRVFPRWPRFLRFRITPRRVAALLLLLGLGVFLARDLIWPPTDEEQVRELFEDLIEAWCDGDFQEVWDLGTEKGVRRYVEADLARIKENGPEFLRSRDPEIGLTREQYLEMDAELFYVVWQEAIARGDPEGWRRTVDALRTLRIEKLDFDGDWATIGCGRVAGNSISLRFKRQQGEWRFVGAMEMGPMTFRTLDRQMPAFLPRAPVEPDTTRLVIEIGVDGVDEDSLARLRDALDVAMKRVERGADVIVDAWPEVPFEDVVAVYDEVLSRRDVNVAFASGKSEAPPRGIRLNGADASQIELPTDLPDVADGPVFSRIIGLSAR